MNISFYTAAVSAQQQQERLDVHANNIANVNTYGFRARIPAFSTLMTGEVEGIDDTLHRGVGSKLEDSELDFSFHDLMETGRALDFAIEGQGFFALLDPLSGEVSFTRDGSFIMSQYTVPAEDAKEWESESEIRWRLSDANGRFVVGTNGQPIELEQFSDTEAPGRQYPIGIFDYANYNSMSSNSQNRLMPVGKNGQLAFGEGKLVQGYLEISNTDLAHELSKVIESQRSFQYMLRMVTTSDEIETTVNSLR